MSNLSKPNKTLRDEFAMVALQGILANPDDDWDNGDGGPEEIARLCYEYADYMLNAREV